MATNSLIFDFLARDRASNTFDRVGDKADGLRGKLGTFGSVVGGVLGAASVALGGLAVAGATMGIKTAAGLEQAGIAFEQLLGSADAAQGFLGDLSSFAATTPFELPGLIDASRQLIGVGQSAESVIPTLTAWGDAAGALGVGQEEFSRIMIAVTQAMSKGKVQAEELMQITENGLPIWPLLARAMGKTVPELQELASKGELLASDVFPALEAQMNKEYGGAMARQSKTLTGLWSTLMDTLNIGLANAILPVQDELRSGMVIAIDLTSRALAMLPPLVEKLRDGLVDLGGFVSDTVIPALQSLAATFGAEGLGGVMTQVLTWLMSIAPQVISFLLEKRQEFFVAAVEMFSSFVDALPVVIPMVVGGIVTLTTMIIDAIVAAIPVLLTAAVTMFQSLTQAAILVLPDILNGVLTIVGAVLAALLENLPLLLDAGMKFLLALLDGLIAALPMILEFIVSDLFPAVLTLITENLPLIIDAGVQLIVALLNGLIAALPDIISFVVTDLIPGIIGAVVSNLPEILSAGVEILGALLSGLVQALPKVVSFFLVDLPAQILGAIDVDMLVDVGGDIIGGLARGMAGTSWLASDAAAETAMGLVMRFSDVLGIRSPSKVFTSFGTNIIQGLVSGIKGAVHLVATLMAAIPVMIKGHFSKAASMLVWAGRALVLGLRAGIQSAAGSVIGTVLALLARVRAIVEAIRAAVASARSAVATVSAMSVSAAAARPAAAPSFAAAPIGRAPAGMPLELTAAPGTDSAFVNLFLGMIRKGQIRLTAGGEPVKAA